MHVGMEQRIDMRSQRALIDSVARFVERSTDRNTDAFKVGHDEISLGFKFCSDRVAARQASL
jgi:hypothetical protein